MFRNDGFDNVDGDYICRVSDVFSSPEGVTYEIVDRLGHGTFGQVLKCSTKDDRHIALKVIKNKPAYFQQGLIEVKILQLLNQSYDLRVVKMSDYFVYRKHLCIVFELLSVNLYDVIKHNSFRGLPFNMVRSIVDQLTRVLVCLKLSNVIHCDLKPENILLTTKKNTKIKLIDFGSAAFQGQQVYTYIQSRFYRSVDVILGILPFTPAIDMWSLGCIVAELFLGLPLFPGNSEFDQLNRIVDLLGPISSRVLDRGKNTRKFFSKTSSGWTLRSREDYEETTGKKEKVSQRKPNVSKSLRDAIMPTSSTLYGEKILSFVSLCLDYDPAERLTAAQAVGHPLFDESITDIAQVQAWRARADDACMRRLTEDATSFVHNSSGEQNPGTPQDPMLSTPMRNIQNLPNSAIKTTPGKPRIASLSDGGRFSTAGPDDSMPLSYRPVLQFATPRQRPPIPMCSPPMCTPDKWV